MRLSNRRLRLAGLAGSRLPRALAARSHRREREPRRCARRNGERRPRTADPEGRRLPGHHGLLRRRRHREQQARLLRPDALRRSRREQHRERRRPEALPGRRPHCSIRTSGAPTHAVVSPPSRSADVASGSATASADRIRDARRPVADVHPARLSCATRAPVRPEISGLWRT